MKTASIISPSVRRRGAILLPIALCLLSLSCEKKMARLVTPASYSSESRGTGGGYAVQTVAAIAPAEQSPESIPGRKIIRNGSLELLVNDVKQSTEKIGSIVSAAGGYVEKATQTSTGTHTASITVRVPAPRLDDVMAEIKRLATNVDRETVEARDVTREYIDLDAHLRNAKAEEAQYLQILKSARTIKDTLDTTEKLSDVRGRIEQLQGEMNYLTSQIDMSSLEISVRAEAEADVAGIHWRPLREAKIAFSEMLSGLADWADSVIAFFVNLPLIAVWLLSIIILLVVAVRIVIFLWKRLVPKVNWRWPWRHASSRDQSAQ